MWAKLKTWCGHSLTVAWGYIQIAFAALLVGFNQWFDAIATLANDPDTVEKFRALLPPRSVGIFLGVIGAITLAARVRSLVKRS